MPRTTVRAHILRACEDIVMDEAVMDLFFGSSSEDSEGTDDASDVSDVEDEDTSESDDYEGLADFAVHIYAQVCTSQSDRVVRKRSFSLNICKSI